MNDEEHMLYLLFHGGYARVVGENDNWTVAHQMAGESGRLLAAAPELLAALKRLVEYCNSHSDYEAISHADDLIAKLEGRGE